MTEEQIGEEQHAPLELAGAEVEETFEAFAASGAGPQAAVSGRGV